MCGAGLCVVLPKNFVFGILFISHEYTHTHTLTPSFTKKPINYSLQQLSFFERGNCENCFNVQKFQCTSTTTTTTTRWRRRHGTLTGCGWCEQIINSYSSIGNKIFDYDSHDSKQTKRKTKKKSLISWNRFYEMIIVLEICNMECIRSRGT